MSTFPTSETALMNFVMNDIMLHNSRPRSIATLVSTRSPPPPERQSAPRRSMQRPRLDTAMRDSWRTLQREYQHLRRAASPDSLSDLDLQLSPSPPDSDRCPHTCSSSSSSGHMETIHEETTEPKVSVKEILARFENLTDNIDCTQVPDLLQPVLLYLNCLLVAG
ncbi:unnamed protein product [Leptidea sinapis]|uniref:Uncharacterized protein n=1 Tax=Leptidea sinapis TaxID=189913 RepID=A0A5E4PN14_9NEOP|nr:unnamed protein product [Leptidea sinapis]